MKASDFGKVAVLMGGISAEREVSLRSGAAILAALQRQGINAQGIDATPDTIGNLQNADFTRAVIALHGRWGEDGIVQGALEAIGMPYTGSGVLGCALAMDKVKTKLVWQALGVATPKFKAIHSDDDLTGLIEALGLPLFIKPACEGSSVGVGKVLHKKDLQEVYKMAASVGDVVLAEQCMKGSELTVAILENKSLPVVKLQTPREFYDFKAKYQTDSTRYHCPAGLPDKLEKRVRDLAERAFSALGCEHWGRVDVMLDQDDEPFLLEVNPVPGMTDTSLVPIAAKQAGLTFDDLVMRILETSL